MIYKLLKELSLKVASGSTPRGGAKTYKAKGTSLIRSQNVLDYEFSENNLVFIDKDQAKKLGNVVVKKNDILLNITGDSVARCCIVPTKILPARVNQHVMIIRIDPKKADVEYIFFRLQYLKEHLLQLSSGGATRKALTKTMVDNLNIHVPQPHIQKHISKILCALTNKIKINNSIISNLESQTQAIFKSWFIDFEPFQDGDFVDSELGRIPKGWEVKLLTDLVEFQGGSQPPKSEHIYEEKKGYVRFIQNRDYSGQNNHLTVSVKRSNQN